MERIPRSQWRRWKAFYELEPWGSATEDCRMGYLTSMYQNVHRKQGDSAKAPEDFFPSLRREEKAEATLATSAGIAQTKLRWKNYAASQARGKIT